MRVQADSAVCGGAGLTCCRFSANTGCRRSFLQGKVRCRTNLPKSVTVRNRNRTYRRFWQAGPGQDRNVYDADTALAVIEYIHNNPVRRGLVSRAEDWP